MKKVKNILLIGIVIIVIFSCNIVSYAGAIYPGDRPGEAGSSTITPGDNPYAPGAGEGAQGGKEPDKDDGGSSSSDTTEEDKGGSFSSGTTSEERDSSHTLGEIVSEGDSFISKGEESSSGIKQESLENMSDILYNILLTAGIIIAFAVGGILGIKFMTGGIEGQADVKNMLVPYIVGCVIVFGAFGIWKLVLTILL